MKEKLINDYKESAFNIVLLQNQIKNMEKEIKIRQDEIAMLNLKCDAISVALALQEDSTSNIE